MSPERQKKWSTFLVRVGIARGIREEGRQEGRQEALKEFVALLKSGYSVDEAQEKLLQNA